MTLNKIYNIWSLTSEDKDIQSQNTSKFYDIVNDIRNSKYIWSTQDMDTFKAFLKHNEKKWFVVNLFSKLDIIPEQLFQPFIEAAIHETNPSANRYFIEPCLRVFGFERVFESLNLHFQNGNNDTKIGVCKAYYWARSPLVSVSKGDGPCETKGYHLKWNGHYYSDYDRDKGTHYEMTASEVSKCEIVLKTLRKARRKLLLEEFLKNKDTDVRYQIKLRLPDDISSFSSENKALANLYFKVLAKDNVPDNYADLQLKKRLGIFGNNKLIRFFLKKKNDRIKKKGLITLKNK
jgi:hypothetical protein